jgi:hypothetical protein
MPVPHPWMREIHQIVSIEIKAYEDWKIYCSRGGQRRSAAQELDRDAHGNAKVESSSPPSPLHCGTEKSDRSL